MGCAVGRGRIVPSCDIDALGNGDVGMEIGWRGERTGDRRGGWHWGGGPTGEGKEMG